MMEFRLIAPDILENINITIWDNSTQKEIARLVNNNKQAFFLIGMTFIAGLLLGFFIHSVYVCIIKRVLIELGDDLSLSDGVVNLSFIGDDSRPPHNDHPPDYASVMSGDTPSENQGLFGFLKKIFKRRSSTDSEDSIVEEPPPSYSSVIENLERDLSSR
ncbi:hypothetical protein HNY73_000300 [Argiope bruennichi]|uniref:Uncharacterized protein n=1 Tax=Argiope bruennichi TaxID=94029 RepID=A0A8T0G0B5_ARGBR|nr:hypothetical protein HNY73_000300 [Argiope bruennichi]